MTLLFLLHSAATVWFKHVIRHVLIHGALGVAGASISVGASPDFPISTLAEVSLQLLHHQLLELYQNNSHCACDHLRWLKRDRRTCFASSVLLHMLSAAPAAWVVRTIGIG
jgi:hypothetical protein